MRRKFVVPKAARINIAKNYRTYLAKLMAGGEFARFNFFADILSGLVTRECEDIPTFCIGIENGYYLMKYSPKMVEELSELGAGIVIAHELGHGALFHVPRMIRYLSLFTHDERKQRAVATILHLAADYGLNTWLIDDCKIFSLKDLKTKVGKPLEDKMFEGSPMGSYAGIHPSDVDLPPRKSLEWYAERLSERILDDEPIDNLVNNSGDSDEDSEKDSEGSGKGSSGTSSEGMVGKLSRAADKLTGAELEALEKASGISGEELVKSLMPAEGDDMSPSELADQLQRDFTRAMRDALESAKGRGNMPGNLSEYVEDLIKPPEVDWRAELRNYCRTAKPSRKKNTLSKPRRKHIHITGCVVPEHPGKRKNPCYRIVFAVDTSASVSSEELQEIFAELRGILTCGEGTEITVIECDTQIGRIYELDAAGDISTKVTGRGGTSFDPVFGYISGNTQWDGKSCQGSVDLLIYATDGECRLPPQEYRIPGNKVLWLISSRGRVPSESSSWGQSVREAKGYGDYGRFIKISR
jgi:predicted metal-dependent peptidase